MTLKKEQILLKLKKKFYLLCPPRWVRQTPTPKGAYCKHFIVWNKYPHLAIIPLAPQMDIKKRVVSPRTWPLPLTETITRLDKAPLWDKKSKKGSRPGAHNHDNFWPYLQYEPQKRNAPVLLMLCIHLKQLKIFMRSIKMVFTTVLLPSGVSTYFLNYPLSAARRNVLPPGQNPHSQMLTSGSMGSNRGVRGKYTPTSTPTGFTNLIPLTGTIRLLPVELKLLWNKKAHIGQGSRVTKASLPKSISSNKKNLLKKGVYTQEDLVKKTSRFINIWCYLQMLFFFFSTLKQPLVALDYPNLGCQTLKSLNLTTYFLSSNRCFLISVKNSGRHPWRRQSYRVLVPTRIPVNYTITWGSLKRVKVQMWALLSLPQVQLGSLKSWIPYLEQRISETSLSRVRKPSLPSNMNKEKSFIGLFYKQKLAKYQTKNFYKYLSFCDYIIFKIIWKLCSRKHNNQSAQWIRGRYFYKLNGQSWVFALKKILFNSAM